MALLPPAYLNAVVEFLDRRDNDSFTTVASGVMLGISLGRDDPESGAALYGTVLVTNSHVWEGEQRLWTRFNKGDETQRLEIGLLDDEGKPAWKKHEHFDVAALPVDANELRDMGAEFAFIEEGNQAFTLERMDRDGISAGDGVYVLGFPMGIAGAEKKRAIVRGGAIARLDAEVITEARGFLIDATIFPGNSGGPVFNQVTTTAIKGTQAVNECSKIGIVSGYLPYTDRAVSEQTGDVRVTFQENSGLALVVPFDPIREVAVSALIEQAGGDQSEVAESADPGQDDDEPPLAAGIGA